MNRISIKDPSDTGYIFKTGDNSSYRHIRKRIFVLGRVDPRILQRIEIMKLHQESAGTKISCGVFEIPGILRVGISPDVRKTAPDAGDVLVLAQTQTVSFSRALDLLLGIDSLFLLL